MHYREVIIKILLLNCDFFFPLSRLGYVKHSLRVQVVHTLYSLTNTRLSRFRYPLLQPYLISMDPVSDPYGNNCAVQNMLGWQFLKNVISLK